MMKLCYLGPLALGIDSPALSDIDLNILPASCFAVEVTPEAGVHGSVIEGDVLLVDECRAPTHDDLVVVELDCHLLLYRAHRIGSGLRLLPPNGGTGLMANSRMVRGVVIERRRCSLEAFF